MLVEVRISNFRSFKNEVVLSMEPYTLNGKKKNLIETSFHKVPYVFKSLGLFGANASGKTNVIRIFAYLKYLMNIGSSQKKDDRFIDERYRFSEEFLKKPTRIQIKFLKGSILYEYAISLTAEKILEENAFFSDLSASARINRIFTRKINENDSYDFSLSKGIKKSWGDEVLPQRVFLADMINNRKADKKELLDIYNFIQKDVFLVESKDSLLNTIVKRMMQDDKVRERVVSFTKEADLGLHDIIFRPVSKEDFFEEIEKRNIDLAKKEELFNKIHPIEVIASHKTEEGGVAHTDFSLSESAGTQVYFALSEVVLTVLKEGKILLIDELDSELHPFLVKKLVNLFNNGEAGAQLIFTSHAHYLMDGETLTRDQIWFTSKENGFYTDLYPLSDFGDKRIDLDFYKSYIRGVYGAVPRIMESYYAKNI